jgi:hypothetical protein
LRPNLVRTCAALLAALAMAACNGGTTAPDPLASTYVLTRVQGSGSPLVIGEFTHASGTRQIYTMVFDSLTFTSETSGRRSFMVVIETIGSEGSVVPPIWTPVSHATHVTRSGDQLVMEYNTATPIKPDTFTVEGGNLVKQGPYGVICPTCAPLQRVEYVYEPR